MTSWAPAVSNGPTSRLAEPPTRVAWPTSLPSTAKVTLPPGWKPSAATVTPAVARSPTVTWAGETVLETVGAALSTRTSTVLEEALWSASPE